MLPRGNNNSKGILEMPSIIEMERRSFIAYELDQINKPKHSDQQKSLMEYSFPRKRKFPDDERDPNKEKNAEKDSEGLTSNANAPCYEASSSVQSKPKDPIDKTNSLIIVSSDNSLEEGEVAKSSKIDFKNELNKEIDKLRKTLEEQIEAGRVLGTQETNHKLFKIKTRFEETLKEVKNELVDLSKIKEIQETLKKLQKDVRGLEKLQQIEENIKVLNAQLVELQFQIKSDKEHYLKNLINIVPIVEKYMKVSVESLELRLREISQKSEQMSQNKILNIRQRRFSCQRCMLRRRQQQLTLSYSDFIEIVNNYFGRIPKWHEENLFSSINDFTITEENNPLWLEYLRLNCANGRNLFINSKNWYWTPWVGSLKEKIKHYVLFWEFIDCETLNFVRNELGMEHVLALGGGDFPYRITYLKYREEKIPEWWKELAKELEIEGMRVVFKCSGDEERCRVMQIFRWGEVDDVGRRIDS